MLWSHRDSLSEEARTDHTLAFIYLPSHQLDPHPTYVVLTPASVKDHIIPLSFSDVHQGSLFLEEARPVMSQGHNIGLQFSFSAIDRSSYPFKISKVTPPQGCSETCFPLAFPLSHLQQAMHLYFPELNWFSLEHNLLFYCTILWFKYTQSWVARNKSSLKYYLP